MASSRLRQCINHSTVVGVRGEHADTHSVPGMQVFNTLIDRVAQDDEYLRRTLAPARALRRLHGMPWPLSQSPMVLSIATVAEAS